MKVNIGDEIRYVGNAQPRLCGQTLTVIRTSERMVQATTGKYERLYSLDLSEIYVLNKNEDLQAAEIKRLEAELSEFRKRHADYKVASLAMAYGRDPEIDSLRQEIERLKAALKTSQGTCVRLNWEQWDLKDERDTLHLKYAALSKTQKEVCDENGILRARVEELEAISVNNAYTKLVLELSATQTERDTLKARVEELEAESNELLQAGGALSVERDALREQINQLVRAELEQIKGDEMYPLRLYTPKKTELEAENARLKAELAATKPVPVVVERYLFVTGSSGYADLDGQRVNVKVTYTDGVLTGVEVVG